MKRSIFYLLTCIASTLAFAAMASDDEKIPATEARYPTSVIADYVLGCMLSNGVSPETLQKCSCSFDFVAESIPYEEYEHVQTLLTLQQVPGTGRVAVYKNSNWAKNAVANLREVQAESTLRCF